MDLSEYITIWEVLGPVIALLATITALSGLPIEKANNTKDILTKNRKRIIFFAIIGFLVTLAINIKSNKKNHEDNIELDGNFTSLKIQNNQLLQSDSLNKILVDSLHVAIRELQRGLIEITTQELDNERKSKKEYQLLLQENLITSINTNLEHIIAWRKINIYDLKNNKTNVLGRHNVDGLKEAQKLPLDLYIKKHLQTCIFRLTTTNDLLDVIEYQDKGGVRNRNVERFIKCCEINTSDLNILLTQVSHFNLSY